MPTCKRHWFGMPAALALLLFAWSAPSGCTDAASPGAQSDAASADGRDAAPGHVDVGDVADAGRATAMDAALNPGGDAQVSQRGPPDAAMQAADAAASSGTLLALSAGELELFVNGEPRGRAAAAQLLSLPVALRAGERNVIAVRATRPAAGEPFVRLELSGPFGRVGTSAHWKARAPDAGQGPDGADSWAAPAFDAGAWAAARELEVASTAPFLAGGPARALWTSDASAAVALFRLELYVPVDWSAASPVGFGAQASGGAGGEVVTVDSSADLQRALCARRNGNGCEDDAPRIVQLAPVVFDYTGSEGKSTVSACVVKQCATGESEYLSNRLGGCDDPPKPTFDVEIDQAGTTPLWVGSNKTLIGMAAGAVLKGKGLTLRGGASNVIIRNLTIQDINPQVVWGGDAITLDGADRVWIDHVRVARIARQMLVTGYGKASNVTVSFSEFDGKTAYSATCNGAHYWMWLILGADDTISFFGNWIHDSAGRAPHAGGMNGASNFLHLIDNYYDHVPGHAVNPLTSLSHVLLEGNYFRQVTTPLQVDTTTAPAPGYAFVPTGAISADTQQACVAALGRDCVSNVLDSESGALPPDAARLDALTDAPAGARVLPYPAEQVPASVPHLAGPGHI